MCGTHILKYNFQLQEVGEKEVSVFTALKLLCKILFENSNIAVRNIHGVNITQYLGLGIGALVM